MPGCPRSCPKVKRELRRRAAERKKALEGGGAVPYDVNDKEKAPERDEELFPEDLEFDGKKQFESIYDPRERDVGVISSESDQDSQEHGHKGKASGKLAFDEGITQDGVEGTEEDLDEVEETTSRGARSAASSRRTLNGDRKNDQDVDEAEETTSRGGRSAADGKRTQDPETSSRGGYSVVSGKRTLDGINRLDEENYPETASKSEGSRRNAGSDFGGSNGESRGPERSGRGRGYRKAGKRGKRRRGDSGGYESDRSEDYDPAEYISDQDESFPQSKHKPCSSECSLQRLKEVMMRRKLEAKQKAVDDYLLNKGMNYFEDLCTCSSVCLAKQLWHDPFVEKIMISAALFAVGIKLCYEMDAWYIHTQ